MNRKVITQLWLCLLCLLPGRAVAQTLEYWFDDHYDQRSTTSIATSDAEQNLSLDLRDNTKFPFGFHRLNMRIFVGGKPSAVYTSHVLKLSAGNASKIEYWLDDDMENSKTIDGEVSDNGNITQFIGELDLSDATPGHHRLYYRAVSGSKRTATAVSCTPIMVKSRYYVENTEDLKVTEYARWFDNEEPEKVSVTSPEKILRREHSFDTRKLSEGQHTLHLQYGNSAGFWGSPLDVTFTKTKMKDPMIIVDAGVKDGTLIMNFNTVPYGYNYTVVRQYPSGSKRKVDFIETTENPVTLRSTDSPGPGNYTYYVEGRYYDADGNKQVVRSLDIGVTIEEAASNVKRGDISGQIFLDGESTGPWFTRYQVYINGELDYGSDYRHKMDKFGKFYIPNVPYGTELTIDIKHDYDIYKFKSITLIVDENSVHNVYRFNGITNGEDDVYIPDDDEKDLCIKSPIHITPSAIEMSVKNMSTMPWSGNMKVVVISKDVKDHYDKENIEDDAAILEKALYYKDASFYTTAADVHVAFHGDKEEKVVSLDITDMPNNYKNEDYYIYVFSEKDGTGLTKTLDGYDNNNPQTLKFNPSEYGVAEEFEQYMKAYAYFLKYVKKFADWGDPFKLEIKTLEKAKDYFYENKFERYIKDIENGQVSFTDLYGQGEDAAIASAGIFLNYFVRDLHKTVTKIKKSEVYNFTVNYANTFDKFYNSVKAAYNASQADDNHKFFELAKVVLKISKQAGFVNDPVIQCYKTYFEVGDAMISAIERLANTMNAPKVFQKLVTGNTIYKIKVRKYTNDKKQRKYFYGDDFYPHKDYQGINVSHPGQIRSIQIELVNTTNGVKAIGTPVEVERDYDGITFQKMNFDNYQTELFTSYEAWMTIEWNNNRVTHVPLLDKNFVKLENLNSNEDVPLKISLELQADTYMNEERIANKLTIIEP